MANSGSNTNKSQLLEFSFFFIQRFFVRYLKTLFFFVSRSFITFRSCRHLDNKHTVFGKIVGGMETLNAIEQVEVDNKDRPIENIVILKAQVFVDPYQEADDQVFLAIIID